MTQPSATRAAAPAEESGALRSKQLRGVVEKYFDALGTGEFDAIPYADDVSLRAPVLPGGVSHPLVGRENLRTIWWASVAPLVGRVKFLGSYLNEELTGACGEALVDVGSPPVTLRVCDRFRFDEQGRIVEQENYFDPRDLTNPGWQESG